MGDTTWFNVNEFYNQILQLEKGKFNLHFWSMWEYIILIIGILCINVLGSIKLKYLLLVKRPGH